MKKRLLIGKIIGTIGIMLFAMGISYVITYQLEKSLYENIDLLVTFEDNEYFSLENTNKLLKDEAIKTYPYIFTIENKGKSRALYEIKIKDEEFKNLERSNLDYVVLLNDKEVLSGSLSSVENNTLYKTSIEKKKTDTYKVYIYLNKEIEEASYKYSLDIISNG